MKFILLTLLVSTHILYTAAHFLPVEFDKAIAVESEHYKNCLNYPNKKYSTGLFYRAFIYPTEPVEFIQLFRSLYNNYYPNQKTPAIKPNNNPRIVKKIHQIWVGPKPLPKEYKKFQNKWRAMHPHWEYKLWTDKDVKNFNLYNKIAYDKAPNYAAKADILRMEILEREGGVYIDIDTEPLKSLDYLVNTFDFFALLNGPKDGSLCVDLYFIGAIAKHPIIQQTIQNIRYYSTHIPMHLQSFKKSIRDTMITGAFAFSRAVIEKISTNVYKNIVLPDYYFSSTKIEPFAYGIHHQKLEWTKEH